MRFILSLFIVFISAASFAQDNGATHSVSFCNQTIPVPDSIMIKSEYEVRGTDFSMNWLYMDEENLDEVSEMFVKQMEQRLNGFKKRPLNVSILDAPAKGYLIKYEQNNKKAWQIIAYGISGGQPVLVQLLLQKEPVSTRDLPAFVTKIVKLGK